MSIDTGIPAETIREGLPPDEEIVGARAGPDEGGTAPGAEEEPVPAGTRLAVAIAFPMIGAAVMVGGVFTGVSPRVYAGIAGIAGIGLGLAVSRMNRRRVLLSNVLIFVGLFAIGLLVVVPSGLGNVFRVQRLAADAASSGDVLRPPVEFSVGWRAITGWLMGMIGFGVAWVAIALRRPALALLLPLPVAAIAGISVPESAQVESGIAVLVLFAVGLALLSSEQAAGEDGTRPPIGYEIRRAVRAVPLLAAMTVGLYFLAQTDFLFPTPYIDPAQEPQRPKTQPLSEVEDRVLFEVESSVSGPWRIGSLDVYDGVDWRLPPFAQNELEDVPRSGIVDPELAPGVRATFTVAGLGGTVLPVLPNTVGIRASGPRLAYDARNGNVRLVAGQVRSGLRYTVVAADLPSVDDLKAIVDPMPERIQREFTRIPDPPPAVTSLIDQAPTTSKWEQFDFLRTWVLENVVASGTGSPVAITPDRVGEMLEPGAEATPFEIVAAQAMLARWIDLPSRIGYGFDGGELINNRLQVRPRHGAAFVEVYFPGFKWLPVIGTPRQAKPTVGSDPSEQRLAPGIEPSEDIAIQLFLPTYVAPESVLAQQLLRIALILAIVAALVAIAWTLYPAFRKAYLRGRRRDAAREAGTRARIALAYAEFRDYATDLGFHYPTDTPLMFLDRFPPDEEHMELAWLTTRALWGDLQDDPNPLLASVAEELSRALRRRLAAAQPGTMRAVAVVSRLSLRDPYAPGTDLTARRAPRKEGERAPQPA